MTDITKDNFLPSLSDQSSYCYLGNIEHQYHMQEMFQNTFGITDESINPGYQGIKNFSPISYVKNYFNVT